MFPYSSRVCRPKLEIGTELWRRCPPQRRLRSCRRRVRVWLTVRRIPAGRGLVQTCSRGRLPRLARHSSRVGWTGRINGRERLKSYSRGRLRRLRLCSLNQFNTLTCCLRASRLFESMTESLVSDTFYNWLAEFAVDSMASASFNSWNRDCFSNGVTLKI